MGGDDAMQVQYFRKARTNYTAESWLLLLHLKIARVAGAPTGKQALLL
jgi:hypothetical protein